MNRPDSTTHIDVSSDAEPTVLGEKPGPHTGPVRFGIKAQLATTLMVLALLTAVACAIALFVFTRIEVAVTDITVTSIPEITLALRVTEVSADITASAPAIEASATQAQRRQQKQALDKAGAQLAELIDEWNERGISPEIASRISDAASRISAQISIVDLAVENRLALQQRLRRMSLNLSRAHAHLLETLEPRIDDAVFELVIESETSNEAIVGALKAAITSGTNDLNRLLTLRANGNLIVSLLRDAPLHSDSPSRNPVLEALGRVRAQFQQDLDVLSISEADEQVHNAGQALLDLAQNERTFLSADVGSEDYRDLMSELDDGKEAFLDLIDPYIFAVREKIVTDIEDIADRQVNDNTEMIDQGSFMLLYLMSLQAEGNLAAGLLSEVISAVDIERLQPMQERFETAADQMDRALGLLGAREDLEQLREAIEAQLAFGREDENLFEIKRAQLQEIETAGASLARSREQAALLQQAVAEFVVIAERLSDQTAANAQQTVDSGKIVMLVISAMSIVGAILIMVLFVGPRLLRPIEETTLTMAALASGDTSVEVPGRERQDEIGRMAHALEVFRDITIEVQESNLREIETTRRRLSDAIESISEAFSLYDADDRLIISNEKYGTLVHPEIAELITPGQKFEDIIQLALDTGFIEAARGREEEWKRERIARHLNPGPPHMMQRTDGIWILVSERRTAEGGVVAVYSDITELKERENELAEKSQALEQLSSQLSKYLSPQIYQSIFTGEQAAVVASRRKKLTVFFSDLAGFTEVADRLEAEDLSALLNEYLTEMSKIALAHGATIDKYVGDAIMIFFGDPVSHGVKADALSCVQMAIAMQDRLKELSISWADYGLVEPLKCRIGIATGFCTVGNFGSEDRMDYTIIGGVVNLASRLEAIVTPGRVLISAETHNLVRDQIPCQEDETVKVKGIAYPVKTYRVSEDGMESGRAAGQIAVLPGKLTVDMDMSAMSAEDRKQASLVLRDLAKKLSRTRK
ncbi:MAG: adenylate/guanylate cyclase domain-containing protein [Pseudomonadota bacterium]